MNPLALTTASSTLPTATPLRFPNLQALKLNNVLHTLVLGSLLGGNNIGDRGAIALAEALKINVTLQELYLSDGMIGDAGAMALAEGLKVNGVRSLHAQTTQPSLPLTLLYVTSFIDRC